jgi:LacI family transcriptional regulator
MDKRDNTRVTIDDIALRMGVANSTVSRALRDDPRISARVTREVKRVAAQMGYVPNITARSLRTGQSHMIGLVARDMRDEFCIETVRAVEEACAAHNYGLLLCNADHDAEKEQFYLRVLQQRRADGILILVPASSTAAPYLWIEPTTPTVLIDTQLEGSPLCAITVDHVLGGYLATRHLLELGHRHIVFLAGPLHLSSSARMVEGYRQAMAEVGIPPERQLTVVTKKTELADGQTGMLEILRCHPKATAIATVSDWMAMGALDTARKQGRRVPDELSIAGYDDILVARLMSPPLTTITYDRNALGALAVNLLLSDMGEKGHVHRQVILPPSLVVRESTAPPRSWA